MNFSWGLKTGVKLKSLPSSPPPLQPHEVFKILDTGNSILLYTVLVHHYFKKNILGLMPSSVPGVIFFDFLNFFLGSFPTLQY